MKSKNLILKIIAFMILIVPSTIKASTVMYMECSVHPKCIDTAELGSVCIASDDNYTIMQMARITDANGNVAPAFVQNHLNVEYHSLKFVNDCWLKGDISNLSNNCSEKTSYQEKDYSKDGINNLICPVALREKKVQFLNTREVVPVGKTFSAKNVETIDNSLFIIYSFKNDDGEEIRIAEGYSSDGKYAFVGGKHRRSVASAIKNLDFESIIKIVDFSNFQSKLISTLHGDYYKVDTNFDALMVAKNGEKSKEISVCDDKDDCINNHEFTIIADSNDSNGLIKRNIQEWYNEQKETIDGLKDLNSFVENGKLINTSEEINEALKNNKNYTFSSDYSFENFTSDLNETYKALNTIVNTFKFTDYSTNTQTSLPSSALSYLYKNVLEIDEIRDLALKDGKNYNINGSYIIESLRDITIEKINEVSNGETIDIININESAEKYTEMLYTTILYLNRDKEKLNLTNQQKEILSELKEKYKPLAKKLNISPIVDCETLLGENLINKINSYLKIIKISVPILLLVYGVIDFTKALFSADEEAMKKAQKTFIQRLFVAILIFIVPTLVDLLLNLANEAWSAITPGRCGIYD